MEVCVALLSALMAAVLITSTEAGCWERQLCCPGKNVTCKGSGPRLNDVKTGKRSRVCFCDEYCLNLRDCCHDYHDTCKRECNKKPGRFNLLYVLVAGDLGNLADESFDSCG